MAYFNGRQYTTYKGIDLSSANSAIRFNIPDVAPTTTTGEHLLYLDAAGSLIYNDGVSATTLVAAGAVAASSWDAIYAGDKTLSIGNGTLTFAGNMSNATSVLTLTNIAGSTGAVIDITNTTTSNPDIIGTSATWQVLGTGVATFLGATFSGTAASTIFTISAGDTVISDGSVAITDADDAASFSVTNNSATTAPMVVLAGSSAHTGSTTNSFVTLTSGATSGTVLYVPAAGLTTGKVIHVVANAVTDGMLVDVTTSSAVQTATGRMLHVASTAVTNTNAVLNEFATAANDETVLLRLTASDVFALGNLLHISASSMTTGTAINAGALDALTTGIGVSIGSTSTGIDTGSLLRISTATTSAVATNGIVSIRATGAYTSTANVGLLDVQSSGLVGTGTLVDFKTSSASQLTNTILNVEQSGTTINYTGTMVRIKATTTTGAATVVALLADGITSGGTAFDLSVDALTTGIGLNIANSGGAMTSGSLLAVTAQGTGAIATNGIVSFTHSGAFTSTSATNGGFVEIKGNSTTAGTIVNVVGSGLTTGVGLQLSNGTSAMTTGSLARFTASGVGTVAVSGAVGGIVSVRHGGIFVSTSNAGVLDVRMSAAVGAATLANFMSTAASQTATNIVNIEQSGATITGYTTSLLRMVSVFAGAGSTGNMIGITAANDVAGDAVLITNNALTLGAGTLVNLVHGTSVIGAGSSMLRITSTGADTGTTTGCLVDLASTTATAGVLMLMTSASLATGKGMLLTLNGLTTGVGFSIGHTTGVVANGGSLLRLTSSANDTSTTTGVLLDLASTASTTGVQMLATLSGLTDGKGFRMVADSLTTGIMVDLESSAAGMNGLYVRCYDGAATDFSVGVDGRVVIAGTTNITALSVTAGDIRTADGAIGSAIENVTLGAGATALPIDSNVVIVTGDGGANSVATITGGFSGQYLTLIFVDGLVTIVNDNTHGADSIDLVGGNLVGADDTTLTLVYDGTSWYEVTRSVNA